MDHWYEQHRGVFPTSRNGFYGLRLFRQTEQGRRRDFGWLLVPEGKGKLKESVVGSYRIGDTRVCTPLYIPVPFPSECSTLFLIVQASRQNVFHIPAAVRSYRHRAITPCTPPPHSQLHEPILSMSGSVNFVYFRKERKVSS